MRRSVSQGPEVRHYHGDLLQSAEHYGTRIASTGRVFKAGVSRYIPPSPIPPCSYVDQETPVLFSIDEMQRIYDPPQSQVESQSQAIQLKQSLIWLISVQIPVDLF